MSLNSTAKRRIYRRDGKVCAYCEARRNLTIDHIMPKYRGGTDDDENLQVLCWNCNKRKGSSLPTTHKRPKKAMKIEGRRVKACHMFDPVTYVPNHAKGDASHEDCEQGVITGFSGEQGVVRVLYCKSRTIQATNPGDLVWG